ncbi:Haloacid dehalogenase-like hydrolase domain-containing protein 2 [Mactra antiquata]
MLFFRNLSRMTYRNIKAVLVDLSGTIHIDDNEIPGSINALKKIRQSNLQIKFVTNTTKESKRLLHARLTKIGFDIKQEEIFTSLTAARKLIDEQKLSPLMLIDDRAKEEFLISDTSSDKLNSVLIGLAPDKFNYTQMNKAFRLLQNGAKLIAIHKARYYKTNDGLNLGPGPFVSALEYSSGCKAEVVGKPQTSFFISAIEDIDIDPSECVMIGDDVRDDVVGAMTAGMNGILVKTGKYRKGDEDYLLTGGNVGDSFAVAVDKILQDQSQT